MHNELTDRQKAIALRLAGETIESISSTLKRTRQWFHKWWQRYLTAGPGGLYDLTRANQRVVNRVSPHLERTILSVRRRLEARATPQTRYALVGAPSIRQELEALQLTLLPSLRTIERVLQRASLTSPPLRLARRLAHSAYPGPKAHDSNQLHQVDVVGPRYLSGDRTTYYFLVCKDVFDQAVYIEFVSSRKADHILTFLVHAWQRLGLPEKVQFDNGREFCGWGRWPRPLSRVIRLSLRLGVEPVFIPEGRPQHNGSVEHFTGWFQPLLLGHRFRTPAQVRREVARLMDTVNGRHVHPQLGYQTPAQYRRAKRVRRRPANCALDGQPIPLAAGKITCIRLVSAQGDITVLGENVRVSKRLKFQDVRATLTTDNQTLKVYYNGRLAHRLSYKLRTK
jgi:transposase InsO family protein